MKVAYAATITADIDVPQGGAEGMLVTQGGETNGYGLYLLKGKPVFTYNLLDIRRFRWECSQTLQPGKHTVGFDFTYDGPGMAKGGIGVLKVDGVEVATQKILHTIAFTMPFDKPSMSGSIPELALTTLTTLCHSDLPVRSTKSPTRLDTSSLPQTTEKRLL